MPSVDFTVFKGSEGGKIVRGTTHREPRADDVVVKITHSGLCFTDILFCKQDIVLGHEGVGLVEQVGPSCTMFKPGDRVGWSYMQGTCGTCDLCFQGEDMYCEKAELYGFCNPDIGSFASHAVIREPFLLRVPDAIESVHAGPLFCSGVTVFEALTRYGVQSTDRVGVIGIGGVGHLAIQFACKMGCEVVAFSSTENKKDEAIQLGASEFHAVNGQESLDNVRPLNCLLVATSSQPDWYLYLDIMAPKGTIIVLTVEMGNLERFPLFPLLRKGLTLQGTVAAPRITYRRMLEFAARHGIKPIVQAFSMNEEGIEQAMQELREGRIRYRGVLVA
ncbi:GroES-like protein [Schizophyllum commune H4-8]|uniref:Enoyl reductase (ER) domain-containing protein n=1 Tax=Schizophyllum commune (strain H4-8 / FGSC 9210) TaxID=578458 RepID=D8Q5C5_SCHCM|nr:GroES-like protein [Schizophyllum commune H4-8]KAI5892238.1 GroES-like protein [Schizophyllum commune H4-8]